MTTSKSKKNTSSKSGSKTIKFKRRKIEMPDEDPIKDLMELYEESDGQESGEDILHHEEKANLKTLIQDTRKKKKKRFIILLSVLLFVFALAAAAGFIFFSAKQTFEDQTLMIEIEAPDEVQIGEEFEYLIKYQNLGNVDLTKPRLMLQYPHGYLLEKATPEATNHQWHLEILSPGDKGEVKITGRIIDEVDREQKLSAKITFEPSNFHSQFSKETSYNVILREPEIQIVNSFPSNITLGQKMAIETKLKNNSEIKFENLKIQYQYPENFELKNSNPEPFDENNTWFINELPELTESNDLKLEGMFDSGLTFSNEEARQQEFTVQILIAGKDEQYYTVKEEKFSAKIIEQAINTYLIVNGSTESKNTELGKTLAFSVIAKNNGDQTYENVTLKTVINCQPIDVLDWSRINDEYYGKINKTDDGKEISWNKNQISALSKLEPNSEVTINFTIPVKNISDFTDTDSSTVGQVKIISQSNLVLDSGVENSKPITSSPVTLALNSNINVGVKALYYFDDGTPIGSGPLPMEAGQITKLRVFWDISNDIHEVKDLTIATTLPDHVFWTDESNVSSGKITYDQYTRKITWNINQLPESVEEEHASFTIEVQPTAEHVNQIIKILGNTTLAGKDSYTEDLIIRTKNIVTSALEHDQYAETNGTIQ